MRDDRYKGTSLPPNIRKLCRMSEREADRDRPERLRDCALSALIADGRRELSEQFRQRLAAEDRRPSFFAINELRSFARSGLEVQTVQNLATGAATATDALTRSLRQRADAYAREQNCRLVADRESFATVATTAVQHACNSAASEAAAIIISKQVAPISRHRVRLDENLLGGRASGATQ